MGGGKPPVKQPPTVAGRPLKVSDEITIIPQGKNTPLAKKVAVSYTKWLKKKIFEKYIFFFK